MFSRINPGRKWSMALASVIYDVNNDYICHGLLRPFLSSERIAAVDHCRALESLGFLKGAILIFDRGYYSETMFRFFSENGYICVMRLKEKIRLAKSCRGDSVLSLDFDDAGSDTTLKIPVRVISVNLGNGTTEYLATNLFNKEYTRDDFKELYFKRWSLELKYNELKNQLLLEEFNGATSISVEQEFFINLLYSNLASLAKSSADREIDENSKSDNRFRYQANRAYIIGRLKDILTPVLVREKSDSEFDNLFRMAARNRSPVAFFTLTVIGIFIVLFVHPGELQYLIGYTVLGLIFTGRAYQCRLNWAKTVLSTYEAVADKEEYDRETSLGMLLKSTFTFCRESVTNRILSNNSSKPLWEFVMIKGSKRTLPSVFVIKQSCLSLATSIATMIIRITSIGLFDAVGSTETRCFRILVPYKPSFGI